ALVYDLGYARSRRADAGRLRRVRARPAPSRAGLAAESGEDVGSIGFVPKPDRARQLSPVAAGGQSAGPGIRSRAEAALHDARLHRRRGWRRRAERRAGDSTRLAARRVAERSPDPDL